MKKILRRIFAAVLVFTLSLSIFNVAFAQNYTSGVDSSMLQIEETLQNMFGAFESALPESSFADFVGTFSGLRGTFDEFLEFHNEVYESRGAVGLTEELFVNATVAVQLEALYTLYLKNIENADEWIEYTTVDLSPYGEFWYVFDLVTGNEYTVALRDDGFERIEVGFEMPSMEIRAIRQALLSPHTIVSDIPLIERNAPPGGTGTIMPVSDGSLGLAPYRSVANAVMRFPNGYLMQSTAFLVANGNYAQSVAVMSGHGVFNMAHGGRATGSISVAQTVNGHALGGTHIPTQYWVDSYWMVWSMDSRDQAVLVFPRGTFGNRAYLQLNPNPLPANRSIYTIGYTVRDHLITLRLHGSMGVIYSDQQTTIWFTAPAFGGMSGGPVLNNNGQVIGINLAGTQWRGGAVRVSVNLVATVNNLRAGRPEAAW